MHNNLFPQNKGLREGAHQRIPLHLNAQQQIAVQAPMGPLLVIAGAGTGKTRTLISRLLRFIENGVSPELICAITFTNKAAKEMEGRVDGARTFLAKNAAPFIGTFHSFGAKILREESRFFGRSPRFAIFDENDAQSLVRKIHKELEAKKTGEGPAVFAHKISSLKNAPAVLRALRASEHPSDELMVRFFELYEKKLEVNNAFDFDDLIQKVFTLFIREPSVLEKYQKKFPHIFIDEYQDLNTAQYELVKLLAKNAESLTAVGDDAQMIYGWRGSDIEIFLNFENDWQNTRAVFLEENYRSTHHIITAASALVKNNTRKSAGWHTKTLWTKNPEGSPVKILELEDEGSEALWIAEAIKNSFLDAETRGRGDTAILYRTNAQSRALEQALLSANIPYHIYGGLKFYERKEVKDVIAGLRYVLNPKDEISRERLEKNLTKSRFSLLEEARAGATTAPDTLPPLALVNFFLTNTKYFEYLEKNFPNAYERKENIASLIDFGSEFTDTAIFLERIALLQANDEIRKKDSPLSPVKLMTIHLAKGLEFETVYLAGACEGLLPHARSMTSERELEEERRLTYVAMTRAKKNLFMSFYDLPSRFISELPEENMEYINLTGEQTLSLEDEERYITLD